jgi:hypothetical protein
MSGLLKEVYVDFPFQLEAFPILFEDAHFTYDVSGAGVKKLEGESDPDRFEARKRRITHKL